MKCIIAGGLFELVKNNLQQQLGFVLIGWSANRFSVEWGLGADRQKQESERKQAYVTDKGLAN